MIAYDYTAARSSHRPDPTSPLPPPCAPPARGAVEYGLMSTTTDKATAFAYSGVTKKRGTVLEITAGRVDVGASISFLSQYPVEDEFLMQPLACLEARANPRTLSCLSPDFLETRTICSDP